jgi:hypothetical protein
VGGGVDGGADLEGFESLTLAGVGHVVDGAGELG